MDTVVVGRKGAGKAGWKEPDRSRQHRKRMTTIVLLTISTIFMTFAWYGHLMQRQAPLFKVILISRGIAFFEYCLAIPANRYGSAGEFARDLEHPDQVRAPARACRIFASFSPRVWAVNGLITYPLTPA